MTIEIESEIMMRTPRRFAQWLQPPTEAHGSRWTRPLLGLLAACLTLASALGAPRTVSLGTLTPEGTSYHRLLLEMREKWRKAPGGGVNLRIYAGGKMGGDAKMVSQMRLGALDAPGVTGQVKAAARKVPNTGGVAIFLGITLPMLAAILTLTAAPAAPIRDRLLEQFPALRPHLSGIASQAPAAFALLSALLILHLMGLIDDRRPLGAYPKLAMMLALATGIVLATPP